MNSMDCAHLEPRPSGSPTSHGAIFPYGSWRRHPDLPRLVREGQLEFVAVGDRRFRRCWPDMT
jgi:hypothetical protein